jgi:hypothetical protein
MTDKTIVRILWGFYLTPIALAVACFIGLVITGDSTYLACGLMACLAAWFVTDHLDEARFELGVSRDGAP